MLSGNNGTRVILRQSHEQRAPIVDHTLIDVTRSQAYHRAATKHSGNDDHHSGGHSGWSMVPPRQAGFDHSDDMVSSHIFSTVVKLRV
jgi:hypothetical protein